MPMQLVKKAEAPAPERTSEREALAAAIAANSEAERAAERGRVAVTHASELVSKNETKLAEAQAAVVDAKERHTAATAAAIGRGGPLPSSALRSARAAQADIQDDLDAAQAALEQLQASLAELDENVVAGEIGIEAAINRVLGVAAGQLVHDLVACRTELIQLLSVCYFIRERAGERRGTFFSPIPELAAPLADIKPEIDSALAAGVPFNSVERALMHPAVEAWAQACAALRDDPDVVLP
jgi:hypothetical protein